MSSRVTSVCFDSQSRLAFLHCVYIRDVRSPIEYGSFAPRLNQLSIRFGCSFLRYLIAIPERGHVLIKRTISKVCSAFNYSLWAIKDIRIRKRDYRARGQYFCWQTRSIQRENDIDGFIYVSSRAYSATLTSKSSEITFKREHCHDRGTFPAISQLLNEAPRL